MSIQKYYRNRLISCRDYASSIILQSPNGSKHIYYNDRNPNTARNYPIKCYDRPEEGIKSICGSGMYKLSNNKVLFNGSMDVIVNTNTEYPLNWTGNTQSGEIVYDGSRVYIQNFYTDTTGQNYGNRVIYNGNDVTTVRAFGHSRVTGACVLKDNGTVLYAGFNNINNKGKQIFSDKENIILNLTDTGISNVIYI